MRAFNIPAIFQTQYIIIDINLSNIMLLFFPINNVLLFQLFFNRMRNSGLKTSTCFIAFRQQRFTQSLENSSSMNYNLTNLKTNVLDICNTRKLFYNFRGSEKLEEL